MYWQNSYQQVPLQLRPMEERKVKVPEDHIFAGYVEVHYKLKNGKVVPKLKARDGWKDQLKGKNIVEFVNKTGKTAIFRQEDLAGGASVRIPPYITVRKEMKNEGRFRNCIRVEITPKIERGIATVQPVLVEIPSTKFIYKDKK